jgi:hypothetical protein
MEMKDDEFQTLRNKVDQISSELDKQNTVRVVNTKWMLIVGAVILSALGFTNFVKIPSEVDKSVTIAVEKAVEKKINEKTGTEIISEALNIRKELVGIKADALKSRDKLVEITKNVKEADFVNLPIGTIMASMLEPSLFAEKVGDTDPFDPKKSKWTLADGREVPTDSNYYKFTRESSVPDLRGMFLRGMNVKGGQDPEKHRKPGYPQKDALQQHGHETTATGFQSNVKDKDSKYQWGGKDLGYTSVGNADLIPGKVSKAISITGADEDYLLQETRPKNVAVYFYIKIN